MNSPLSPRVEMPALPVRRRETLEILDTALKLYRRYFWVLIGWSAMVSCFAFVPFLNWFSVFAMPLLFGAVSCCVAAAVRGQKVTFSQCWAFTKPRYGPLLGTLLLSYLVLSGVVIVLYIAGALIGLLGVWLLSSAPEPVQIIGAIVGVLLLLVAFSVMGVVAFGWTSMVPIVVCLEDDKRSTAAMGRAFELLKGNWKRVFGLSLILGLAGIVVFVLVGAFYALFGFSSFGSILTNPSESAILGLFATFGAFMGLILMLWNPAQTLIIAVLYLDLRVRREALDLEWSAYSSAPAPNANQSVSPAATPYLYPNAALREETPFSDGGALGGAAPSAPASFAAGSVDRSVELAPQTPIQPPASDENEARRD